MKAGSGAHCSLSLSSLSSWRDLGMRLFFNISVRAQVSSTVTRWQGLWKGSWKTPLWKPRPVLPLWKSGRSLCEVTWLGADLGWRSLRSGDADTSLCSCAVQRTCQLQLSSGFSGSYSQGAPALFTPSHVFLPLPIHFPLSVLHPPSQGLFKWGIFQSGAVILLGILFWSLLSLWLAFSSLSPAICFCR